MTATAARAYPPRRLAASRRPCEHMFVHGPEIRGQRWRSWRRESTTARSLGRLGVRGLRCAIGAGRDISRTATAVRDVGDPCDRSRSPPPTMPSCSACTWGTDTSAQSRGRSGCGSSWTRTTRRSSTRPRLSAPRVPAQPGRSRAVHDGSEVILFSTTGIWPACSRSTDRARNTTGPIALEPWQQRIVTTAPWAFLRGCIRSDGCVFINRTGRYEYLSYGFTNYSPDILDLFESTCPRRACGRAGTQGDPAQPARRRGPPPRACGREVVTLEPLLLNPRRLWRNLADARRSGRRELTLVEVRVLSAALGPVATLATGPRRYRLGD